MVKLKIGIMGYARHGKDTVAEILANKLNYVFCSSSFFVCAKVIYPVLSKRYGYSSHEECFNDRINHRSEWKELITGYNSEDKSKLARELLEESDIYVGMRCKDELSTCIYQEVFDILIWVTDPRKPEEDVSSCTIRYENFNWDFVIINESSLEDLRLQVEALADTIIDTIEAYKK